ncbi:hypothetical protein SAMN04487946_10281 [Halobellus clavatus]|uniref:Uncharacterized protein n=1 Tax=Halobellus clavatus TaxID=660517 RepID=A0A1H3E6X1_9EURY|nr:hypothetical protein SAMN04487946_10281 [Halobellus clavatus]
MDTVIFQSFESLEFFQLDLSLVVSFCVLVVYVLQYRRQGRQLEEQHRQIQNQEAQLAAQREQLDKQEQELEQYERELAQLEQQTELAEVEHQAHIEVEDYEFENDRVIVLLSNYGNGVATDLRLETILTAAESEYVQPHAGESRLRRRDADGNQPYEGQALRPGAQRVEFEGEAIVEVETPTPSPKRSSRSSANTGARTGESASHSVLGGVRSTAASRRRGTAPRARPRTRACRAPTARRTADRPSLRTPLGRSASRA